LQDGFLRDTRQVHASFRIAEKRQILDDCKIQCPLHRARFDIRTGEVIDWANFPPVCNC